MGRMGQRNKSQQGRMMGGIGIGIGSRKECRLMNTGLIGLVMMYGINSFANVLIDSTFFPLLPSSFFLPPSRSFSG